MDLLTPAQSTKYDNTPDGGMYCTEKRITVVKNICRYDFPINRYFIDGHHVSHIGCNSSQTFSSFFRISFMESMLSLTWAGSISLYASIYYSK